MSDSRIHQRLARGDEESLPVWVTESAIGYFMARCGSLIFGKQGGRIQQKFASPA
jgi:hypothetical protein